MATLHVELDVRDYDLVGDPYAIEPVAERVRARLEPVLPQTELSLEGRIGGGEAVRAS